MGHITKIRVANTSRTVEAEVYPCGFEDMVTWQRKIHKHFIKPTEEIGSNWDWPALFVGCHFSEQMFSRQALAFQIRVADQAGNAVPVVQAILSLPYAWPGNKTEKCVFLWFVAATPTPALTAFGIIDRFSVLAPVLDVAVQVSIAHELEGRVGLHAAVGCTAEKSDALIQRYLRIGLSRRKELLGFFRLQRFFRFPHRFEDGRLFYFDPKDALAFSKKQDDLR